ncbi:OVARIAN TUMOR DOMAIN-containing deubiquitinating enzyme 4-like [Lycium barbarum]|uniref:OVARIAN TUMOR DOMAIN-containing deubiquitinating enzyme 4-like n=1 Tax=Lycium barbarum TaxID=112863 RepID=UPI00293E14EE|nr:OVARIAN TUMOR DOMAIN-containing deubiquitinating enzyme 4-like [Lycium barbarum]XP_060183524.1 OVARIAN TUMOR DOMAIN-containing deubiquitinating enzyme 4-like [Lycium barbarum]XP_060183525.1 OVARIAN TUMOR DOMAIN-containing deubiquitinating enzyme 4-like [Lycium barbarum]XP_060183526.1 OVARIAN TUMOR DOMAIN-containing deubiquitinating enzyme 4-like [Lycium barbarum]
MLGVFCARPKPWLFASLCLSHAHGSAPSGYSRLITSPTKSVLVGLDQLQSRHHSSHCVIGASLNRGGAASIWHAILPAGRRNKDVKRRNNNNNNNNNNHHYELAKKGEGSWNVAWDSRPARWLHNPDSAWLLFGVCSCLAAPSIDLQDVNSDVAVLTDKKSVNSDGGDQNSANYRVTGVPADGRCLFRAIAHMACLRNGEEAPDENRQRELADELRAQVVDELLKRRKEAEWFIEGDFDAYVKRIEKPYVWGGEPELLMASHVLKSSISVYMVDRSSGSLINISNYGEEYRKEGESPINVLFHGYGHYDILETISKKFHQKLEE